MLREEKDRDGAQERVSVKQGVVQKGREGTQTPLRAWQLPWPAQGTSKWLLVLPWSWRERWLRDKPEERVFLADPCWLLKETSQCSVQGFILPGNFLE